MIAPLTRFSLRALKNCLIVSTGLIALALTAAESPTAHITIPDAFEIEVVAAPPLVGFPMMGCFDERGRLFLAESAGLNMGIEELEKATPNFIRMLEDTDGDEKFDRSTTLWPRCWRLRMPSNIKWFPIG